MTYIIFIILLGLIVIVGGIGGAYLLWRLLWPQNKQQDLVNMLDHAAVVIDNKSEIMVANQRATQLLLEIKDPLIGSRLRPLFKGSWPKSLRSMSERTRFTAVIADDSVRTYELQISPIQIWLHDISYLVTLTAQNPDSTQAEQQALQVNKDLMTIADQATRAPHMRHTAPAILKNLIDMTKAEGGNLLVFDRQQDVALGISMSKGNAQVRVMDDETAAQATHQGFVQEVLQSKEKLLAGDITTSKRWQHLHTSRVPLRSVLAVPLMHKKEVRGVITLTHTKANRFGGDQLQLINTGTTLISQILANSQNYEEQVSFSTRQKLIDHILHLVGQPGQAADLAQKMADLVVEQTSWMMVAILKQRPDKELLSILGIKTRLYMQSNYDLPLDQSFSGQAFTTGETQVITEGINSTGTIEQPPMMSLICIPLTQGSERIGVLTIGSDRHDAFSKEDVLLAESLGEAVGVALSNAHFHDQAHQYANNLTALFDATKRISRLLNIDEIFQEALNTAIRFTGFEAGLISLEQDGKKLILAHKSGMNRFADSLTAEIDLSATVSGMVHHRASYVLLENSLFPSLTRKMVSKNRPEAMQLLRDMGYIAYAGAPLFYQNKSLGTLCLFHGKAKTLSEEERSVHLALSQQTGAMVANARLVNTIRSERQRLQTVIRSSHEGIIMIGESGEVQVLNETAVSLLGLKQTPDAWRNRHLRHLVRAIRENIWDLFTQLRHAQKAAVTENSQIWKGSTRQGDLYLDWVCVPVEESGHRQGRLFVVYNVSESHQLQELREDLVYTMVHDLRNPIGIANMSIQYFRDRFQYEWDADDMEVLNGIETALQKSLNLVTSILEISRLEDQSMPVNPSWVEPAFLLTQSAVKQETLAQQKEINLDIDLPTDLPLVWADIDLIERVMQNLIDNAIKFTPSGGKVTISSYVDDDTNSLFVSVADNGNGIPEGVKLFEKFSKGGQEERGSGLGLAFCRMALEAHQQKIWVARSTNEGTTLTFSLATQSDDANLEYFIVDN